MKKECVLLSDAFNGSSVVYSGVLNTSGGLANWGGQKSLKLLIGSGVGKYN